MPYKCGDCLNDGALVERGDPFFLQACLNLRPTFLALHLFEFVYKKYSESKQDRNIFFLQNCKKWRTMNSKD